MIDDEDTFGELEGFTTYRMERKIGKHLLFVGYYNKAKEEDEPLSFEYWIEIDRIKIPSSVGYCRTEHEFKTRVLESAKDLAKDLINDFTPVLMDEVKP